MSQRVTAQSRTSLHISNLNSSVTTSDLGAVFNAYVADILRVKLSNNSSQHKVATIEFSSYATAQLARRTTNGQVLNGREILVSEFDGSYKDKVQFNVFVKNFPQDVTAQELELEFEDCGHIMSVKVAKDAAGKTMRYGFIQFNSAEAAANAIAKNAQVWRGETLTMEQFRPMKDRTELTASPDNLYVCGFANTTSKTQLDQVFSQFGEIYSSVIETKVTKNEVKRHAFVRFMNPNTATEARTALNGTETLGGVLQVQPYMSKQVRNQFLKTEYREKQSQWKKTNLVFNKLPPSISESELRSLCEPFGPITSVKINRKSNVRFHNGIPEIEEISTGTGFVNFEHIESSQKAQETLHRRRIGNANIFVSHWRPRQELQLFLKTLKSRKAKTEYPTHITTVPALSVNLRFREPQDAATAKPLVISAPMAVCIQQQLNEKPSSAYN